MISTIVRNEKKGQRLANIDAPFGDSTGDLRQKVLHALQKVLVSPKPDHGRKGQLHNATKYRILEKAQVEKKEIKPQAIRYMRSFDKIKTKKDVSNIMFNTKTLCTDIP